MSRTMRLASTVRTVLLTDKARGPRADPALPRRRGGTGQARPVPPVSLEMTPRIESAIERLRAWRSAGENCAIHFHVYSGEVTLTDYTGGGRRDAHFASAEKALAA